MVIAPKRKKVFQLSLSGDDPVSVLQIPVCGVPYQPFAGRMMWQIQGRPFWVLYSEYNFVTAFNLLP